MTDPSPERPPVLVTGVAGFIGFHVARALLDAGTCVIGVDSMNAYYDPKLKEARLRELQGRPAFFFHCLNLADRDRTAALFAAARPRLVIHMAAQAGVRYSLIDPHAYMDANIVGFLNVLEGCRHHGVEQRPRHVKADEARRSGDEDMGLAPARVCHIAFLAATPVLG